MSCCTTTVSNSVRKIAPVGQASRQGAGLQCLQTSDIISQLLWKAGWALSRTSFSMKATCRQVVEDSRRVLS